MKEVKPLSFKAKQTHERIDENIEKGKFTKNEKNIERHIILDCGMACAKLYDILLSYKNEYQYDKCHPSNSLLMSTCCISSKATLITYLNKLEEFGYIKIKSGGGNSSNKYFFPKADISITHYTQEELNYINSIERKKPTINTNVSEKSKENLKNYKKVNNVSNIETNPFEQQ